MSCQYVRQASPAQILGFLLPDPRAILFGFRFPIELRPSQIAAAGAPFQNDGGRGDAAPKQDPGGSAPLAAGRLPPPGALHQNSCPLGARQDCRPNIAEPIAAPTAAD